MRPSTRAVSLIVSFWLVWEPVAPMYVTCAPWSYAATSKAERVRVESFSNSSAIVLPTRRRSSRPSRFAALSSAASSSRSSSSSRDECASVRKCRTGSSVTAPSSSLERRARAGGARKRLRPAFSLDRVLARVVPVHHQCPENHERQEEHGECPERVLRVAHKSELLEERDDADDDREPARPAGAAEQPEACEEDDDPPEEGDPAPRRRVEDDDLVRRHREVLAADDRDQALEEVDASDDYHQAAGEADPPRPSRVPCH